MNKDKGDEPENCIINNKINWNTIDKQTYQTMLTQDFQEELSVIGDTSDYINKLAEILMLNKPKLWAKKDVNLGLQKFQL